eukprot:CAMPEP_0172865142 /NCGR_PEP_ID=MMETSP1075-20121228/81233_2 /TAXON_ID=2916 /ORGANISM="Ceratium fusus, Strain PA161109" /LENGTH=99 /DNA_ID=CAMNT_0013714133 /DNA_START=31 /DNA_END=327 /DNA_ORIENTATION=-
MNAVQDLPPKQLLLQLLGALLGTRWQRRYVAANLDRALHRLCHLLCYRVGSSVSCTLHAGASDRWGCSDLANKAVRFPRRGLKTARYTSLDSQSKFCWR